MMTMITGLPGSCKTLYTVDKLLRPLVTATIKHIGEDGVEQEHKRRIFSNINGLLLEHEKIDLKQLDDWHKWAKPGDVIVADEFQKQWPLAATGSKVPDCIQALETHRHMGVDFILITQHPMLVHVNVTRLVGRHLHMRRLGNMGFATVYEWDGCSRTLLYKNCMAKGPYRFNRKAFDLYKSAEVHTRQPRKLPSLIWGVALGLGGLVWAVPTVQGRLSERLNPQSLVEHAAKAKEGPTAAVSVQGGQPVPASVQSQPAPFSQAPAPLPVDGCAASAARCTCYSSSGAIVPVPEHICRAGAATAGLVVYADPSGL